MARDILSRSDGVHDRARINAPGQIHEYQQAADALVLIDRTDLVQDLVHRHIGGQAVFMDANANLPARTVAAK